MSNGSRTENVPMKIIRGKLIASNTEAASIQGKRLRLERAFEENRLAALTLWNLTWLENRVLFNSVYPVHDTAANIVPQFLDSLNRAMQTEIARELNLTGKMILVIETANEEPTVVRISVTDGEVSYRRSEYVWSEETTLHRLVTGPTNTDHH